MYIINPFIEVAHVCWELVKPRFNEVEPEAKNLQQLNLVAGGVGVVAGVIFKMMGASANVYKPTIAISATLFLAGVLGSYALMIGTIAFAYLAVLGGLLMALPQRPVY